MLIPRNPEEPRILLAKPFITLVLVTIIKLYSIFQAALGGALDMSSIDKTYLTDIYIKNYITQIKTETESENKDFATLDALASEITDIRLKLRTKEEQSLLEKVNEKEKEFAKTGTNPVIQLYQQVKKKEIDIKLNQAILQDPNTQDPNVRAQTVNANKTAANQIAELRRQMEAFGVKTPTTKSVQVDPNNPGEINASVGRPATDQQVRVTETLKFLKENDPETFIKKYFPARYGQAFTDNLLKMIKDADMAELPIGDRVHILQEKLGYELTHGLIPSLLAVAAIAIFLEGMSTYTLWSVMTSPKYQMLFSNRSFQESMAQVNAVMIKYIARISKQIKSANGDEESFIAIGNSLKARPLATQIVWERIITQMVREGTIESVNAFVENYVQQFIRKKPKKQKE